MLLTLCSLTKLKQVYCVLRLLCIALVISLLMNQTKTLMFGTLNPGNLEPQNPGNLELWNLGTLELSKSATLQPWQPAIVESWNPTKPWNLA